MVDPGSGSSGRGTPPSDPEEGQPAVTPPPEPEREHAEAPPWYDRQWARIAGATIAVLALLLALLWQRCGWRGCPDVDELRGHMPEEASVVLDRTGEEVGRLFVTNRVAVPIDSIPEIVQQAFIAIEDRRFREHDGVDWRRVMGAFWTNVSSLEIEEGSSTITMQLARNVFPDKLPANQQTLWRKLGEARVAKEIEERYTKDQIMELYLNQIYFGSGAWGIEAAAQEYFGSHVWDLELPEAALLAALPRAPSRYNPRASEEAALAGRRLVLDRMVEQGWVDAAEAEAAAEEELTLRRRDLGVREPAPYFLEAVRRVLEDQLGSAVYTEGYRIHTTLDLDAQAAVEETLEAQLRRIESGAYGTFRHPTYASVHDDSASLERGTPYLQGAAVVMEATTGDVLALVGGRDFDDSQFNRATQALRQPGSAFKPFVYTAALQAGLPPTHRVLDEPIRLVLDDGRIWEPRNYEGGYAGIVTMRNALTHSRNVATVRIANEVGVARVAAIAQRLGVADHIPTNPSMVLGTAETTPLRLTAAYATYATLGRRPEPRFVIRVEDRDGRTVFAQPAAVQEVLDATLAFLTTSLMRDVVDRGTGWAVRSVGFRGPAAGKTGTTQDASDAWFVGFTPRIVATVWVGFDRRARIVRGATGGELAAPVWGRFMRRIAEPGDPWPVPGGIETRTVDEAGRIVADNCPVTGPTREEYFLVGTVPLVDCWPEGYLTYADSLGLYGEYVDSAEEAWWQRFRNRIFGDDDAEDSLRLDSLRRRADSISAIRIDTTALRRMRDSTDAARRDSARDTLRVRRDTLRDTLRVRRDTLRDTVRVRRDTLRDTVRVRRDTLRDTVRVRRDTLGATLSVPPDSVRLRTTRGGDRRRR